MNSALLRPGRAKLGAQVGQLVLSFFPKALEAEKSDNNCLVDPKPAAWRWIFFRRALALCLVLLVHPENQIKTMKGKDWQDD